MVSALPGELIILSAVGIITAVFAVSFTPVWVVLFSLRRRSRPGQAIRTVDYVAVIAAFRPLAKEVIEEILHAALAALAVVATLLVVVVGILLVGIGHALMEAPVLVGRLLGQRLGIDIDHRRSDRLGDLYKFVGGHRRIDHLEGRGIGADILLLLTADSMRNVRAGDDAGGERSKKNEYRGETARA